ncbi:MAG: DNA-binding response regulator [Rhodoblastus sp.]
MMGSVILIVDDDPGTLAFLSDALEPQALTVLVARSGEAAVSILARMTPDVILLDAIMPGLDGFETCRRIKRVDRLSGVPVIFMTGLSDTDHVVQGFTAGGVDYVTKPIIVEQLLARLRTHVSNARMASRARSALDASGRHLFAIDAQGVFLWGTPKARELLGFRDEVAQENTTAALRQLALAGADNAARESELRLADGTRLRVSSLGAASNSEFLFRITEFDEEGVGGALSRALAVTAREGEVLLWLARGKSNADIASILSVSPRTVNKHLEQIYKKLGVENRAAAVRAAMQVIESL